MKKIMIGKIVNFYGIRGAVKVISDSDFKKERLKKNKKIYIQKNGQLIKELIISKYNIGTNFDVLYFKNIVNINEILEIKNSYILVDQENILLDKNEFFYDDIYKCNVLSDNNFIGKVYKILNMNVYDLWYIKRKNKKDLIIPFTKEFVNNIDLDNRKIYIKIIEGMD